MPGTLTSQILFNLAVVGYVCATGLALAHLVHRHDLVYRLASLATLGGWLCHTVSLIHVVVETGRPPLGSLPKAVSMIVWVVVLLEMWVERRRGVRVLGGFVMPIALVLSLKAVARPLGLPAMGPGLGSAWIWVHISLVTVGIAAFVLNFAGALMYLIQERELKSKRLGAMSYRLPDLETLDRLTYQALAIGFPFLTVGLILGALSAGAAWGSVFTLDPLVALSPMAWAVYAATLAGRAAAGWRGRRAAHFAVLGFAVLVLTLGAGLFLPGRHGS